MKTERKRKLHRMRAPGAAWLLLLFLAAGAFLPVRAASGNVYTCTVHPTYSHPVTGEIEDAGGSSSMATGQGMVEGAVGTTGLLEVTDDGKYYLTFRMSLIDYTSEHSFSVQEIGASGWDSVGVETTGSGSDSSGKTADMRVQLPSESAIVRCSMYVDPMGRDVVFYFYPSDYSAGNSTDMTAAIVTEASAGNADSSSDTAQAEETQASTETAAETAAATTAAAQDTSASDDTEAVSTGDADASLNAAQGLSLSTEPEETETDAAAEDSDGGISLFGLFLTITAAVTVSGLILLAVGAYLVYHFRRNWKRWGEREQTLAPEEARTGVYMAEGFGEADPDGDVWDSPGVEHEEDWDMSETEPEDGDDGNRPGTKPEEDGVCSGTEPGDDSELPEMEDEEDWEYLEGGEDDED